LEKEADINRNGDRIDIKHDLKEYKEELRMNVFVYASFAYAFTAIIALSMIGAIVLLDKVMGGGGGAGNAQGEE
jgi:hypothetical protein